MKKRGQVTLLVILGLIILIFAVFVVVYKDVLFLSDWERQRQASLIVPEEVQEPNDFILACIEETTQNALELLGSQGGYILIPSDTIPQTDANMFSNYLEVFEGGDYNVAYWFYETANGVQKSAAPTIEEMQEHLVYYLNQNLGKCTNDFDMFETYNMTAGPIETEVDIQDDQVLFTIEYPLRVTLDSFRYNFDTFFYSMNVPLGDLHDLAAEIIANSDNEFFLEERTIDLFAINEELPLSDLEVSCEVDTWSKTGVKEDLKNYLDANVAQVKLVGTDYDMSDSDSVYYEWDVLDYNRYNVKANLEYFTSWPLYLDVFPSEGDLMLSEPVIPEMPGGEGPSYLKAFFCLNTYNFVYDIKYPVLISLYDETSDYVFQFAYMVIIDNNQPRENELGLLDVVDPETPICENAFWPATVYVVAPREDGLLETVNDATVSYKCITQVCEIGETSSTATGVGITADFPACYNGFILAEKEGLHPGKTQFSSIDEDEAYVILERYYEFNVKVKVVDESGSIRDPLSSESISIQLNNEELDYSTSVAYPMEGFNTITLISGDYDINAYIVTDAVFDFVIEEQEVEHCVTNPVKSLFSFFGTDEECTTVEIPSMTLDSLVSGGGEYLWTLGRDELSSASTITFYVNSYGTPSTYDELSDVYSKLEEGTGITYPELT
ncbi:MAG: hypothetical protein ABIF40_02565 [archaeon]